MTNETFVDRVLSWLPYILLCTISLVSGATLHTVTEIWTVQRSDNQTISFLRSQNTQLTKDLKEMDEALDKEAAANLQLRDQLKVETMNRELEKAAREKKTI